MKIALITPASARDRNGNRNTASRWAGFLRELGHRVEIAQVWSGASADCMIALHARRSHASVQRFADACAERPLIVALTGTDLYRDIRNDASAKHSLALATRLVVLQERGVDAVPPRHRAKTCVIYQSATNARVPPLRSCFEVVVSGHLREEKDPFRSAAALSHLPVHTRACVTHIGRALSAEMAEAAQAWMAREPRYRWRGELPRSRALRVLGRAQVLVVTSRMEGGANVISEALAAGVPVIASRVPGNVGMLGADYGGYFAVGNERALARLMWRAENEPAFLESLRRACAARAALVSPARERSRLALLIESCTTRHARAAQAAA